MCTHVPPIPGLYPHTYLLQGPYVYNTCACTHRVPQPALGLSPKGRFQPDGQLLEKCEIPGGDAWRLPHRWEGLCRGRGDPTWALSCLLSPTLAQELRSPSGAEVPYCDLPRCPPAPEDPLSASTSGCRSVVDPGLRPGSRRWVRVPGPGERLHGVECPCPSHLHSFPKATPVCNGCWHGSRGQSSKSRHRWAVGMLLGQTGKAQSTPPCLHLGG